MQLFIRRSQDCDKVSHYLDGCRILLQLFLMGKSYLFELGLVLTSLILEILLSDVLKSCDLLLAEHPHLLDSIVAVGLAFLAAAAG